MSSSADKDRSTRERPSRATLVWALPYPVLVLALVIWLALGLVEGDAATIIGCSVAAAAVVGACALVTLSRDRVRGSYLADAGLLVAASVAAAFALEVSWCRDNLAVEPKFLALEAGFALLALLALYLVFQRRGIGAGIGVGVFCAMGLAQYFVRVHKGTAILPSDVLGMATAMSVAGGYVYKIDGTVILGIAIAAVGWCLCSLMHGREADSEKGRAPRRCKEADSEKGRARRRRKLTVAGNLGAAAACVGSFVAMVTLVDFGVALGVHVDGWDTARSYERYGAITSFVAAAQDLEIPRPAGYSSGQAVADEQELADDYAVSTDPDARAAAQAQFADTRPSIVCVMNESFSDMSLYDGLGVGYEGPAYFNSIDDALVRGQLAVSTYAGGTCNTEFEFLTGNTLGYLGKGAYPYTLYDLSTTDNLASQLSSLGYDTCAIHPNLGTNWNREGIYAGFGFDEFLTIDRFEDAPQFHSGVTDAATYEEVLGRLRGSSNPQFIFDVTMQNHSSYDQDNIDPSLLRGYEPDYLNESQAAELNEYLACIDASDRDLEWFIGELRKLDRPVLLVFFGDHQASVSAAVNDAMFPDEADQTHGARMYLTNYLVWANYDVAGAGSMRVEEASSSTLGALALDAVGAPLSGYQEAQLGARLSMPTISALSYTDVEDRRHATGGLKTLAGADPNGDPAARARDAYLKLARVQYHRFAEHVQ